MDNRIRSAIAATLLSLPMLAAAGDVETVARRSVYSRTFRTGERLDATRVETTTAGAKRPAVVLELSVFANGPAGTPAYLVRLTPAEAIEFAKSLSDAAREPVKPAKPVRPAKP